MKRYFDIIAIVPLEEEFDVVTDSFRFTEDLTTERHIRFAMSLKEGSEIQVLVVKQSVMGRAGCQDATGEALDTFDCGIVVCIGIAGALSSDLSIGDVCYSRDVCDVVDNTKIQSKPKSQKRLMLSPVWYHSPSELRIPFALDRVHPLTKASYIAWTEEMEEMGRKLLPGEFPGKGGKEKVIRPKVIEGSIACGFVSSSPEYNDILRSIDRKMLVIETESGGMFSEAQRRDVAAITVRGVSDYAGIDKNEFERATYGRARKYAAISATSFLVRQLRSAEVRRYLDSLRTKRATDTTPTLLDPLETRAESAAEILLRHNEGFSEKLRDLAPGYALVSQGYRLPVPRIRIVSTRSGSPDRRLSEPLEIRDALRGTRVITLHVPREYPDLSLSWIIASNLLSTQIGDTQLVPSVVEASNLYRPRIGIAQLVAPKIVKLTASPAFTNVFIIDDFNFSQRSRCEFLREQIDEWSNAKFIIVTRNREDVYLEADLTKDIASSVSRLCDVSFSEIASFIQKNFHMVPSAAEVVAMRLRETFSKYGLPAHPSYFAGIPSNILNALLQANRRAELIELAVAGYLSFMVADDREPVALSRTTREKFLSELAFSMRVEGRSYTEAQLAAYADDVAKKYDYHVSSARFVASFIEKHILHVEDGQIRFTLPFMEAYVLAKRLLEEPQRAEKYFLLSSDGYDFKTFGIYAELGPAPGIVTRLQDELDSAIKTLTEDSDKTPIMLDPSVPVPVLDNQDRIRVIQKRLQKAEEDVRNDKDQTNEKQRWLDATDRIREDFASRTSALKQRDGAFAGRIPGIPNEVETTWAVAVNLLGSGAERLEASVKRSLVQKVVRLTSLIIDQWTRAALTIDFSEVKRDLLNREDLIERISKSAFVSDTDEARRVLGSLVDLIAYIYVLQPFAGALTYLCEEARNIVLAESIAKSGIDEGGIDELLQNMWLTDINVQVGRARLVKTIKSLPKSRFLRHVLAAYLMTRVFWNHWRKEDRLILLNIADMSMRGMGLRTKTGELQRIIENLPDDEAAAL